MRKIKFRGRITDTKEWVCGSLIIYHDGEYNILTSRNNHSSKMDDWRIDADTVGQFTGLHDKNGKEIYEGDILLCHGKYTFKVIWMNCSFIAKGKVKEIYNTVGIGNFFPAEIEVIGNIHDNPELMKGGTK